ncbi:16S rRNA (cytosine(967)-C(5))-methyltransferase RsmB [Lactiplantibacillus plantarum]|uniref:16S rRNA (cytosine(967)-C(5))-methyltransferase RsmB n=1 Tax=Lactiplantibacillus plantarum TaxID=1590 RepID=UPI000FECBF71|nr:16S rRNA (cytosine(967)-C(5))-methyltransferase RsmB [Lactiplantibacillus plantarum]QAR37621.1 16S rRNA (cytosine(967)-C(5))-methyltransferase RsmB [Lactiplantibacillus plantarum]RWZ07796.1 16S rRNA (cytosine(967)-C(5))-methyltransferase RsmB [Lactiplantibacillus plantarum]RWZ35636.1 16S rRNA (cytosine(967)-C(5))-methyltransferase RsmB [Lactiplantibacillus plantarum]
MSTVGNTPRWLAVAALAKIKNGAYSNLQLNQLINDHQMDRRDINLLTNMVYGVIQHRLTLEYWLTPFVRHPHQIDPWVRELLLSALYQWQYLDKIPQRAVFNETIEIAKVKGHPGIRRFVTGVLHQMDRSGLPNFDAIKDPDERLSVTYSMPIWLIQELRRQLGAEKMERILSSLNQPAKQALRVNPALSTVEDVTTVLINDGLTITPSEISPLGLIATDGQAINTEAMRYGMFTVQDESAQLVVPALNLQPSDRVLDACAAPGGKTTQIAASLDAEQGGTVVALDIHANKVKLIGQNAARMHVADRVEATELDARKVETQFNAESFDRILVDAPCSGLGLMRRKPEIRYEKQLQDSLNLQRIQLAILTAVAPTLKKGGIMTYSTCTILQQENQDVITKFLADHPDFELQTTPTERDLKTDRTEKTLSIYPDDYLSDGFFIACLRKK